MIKGCKILVAWFEKTKNKQTKKKPPCASYLRATVLCPWLSESSRISQGCLALSGTDRFSVSPSFWY